MTHMHWGILGGMALAFSIQSAFAGNAWLVITSDPPGATIAVDNVYRGVTPQRPSDALRLQVPKGVRQINARVRVDGKDYTTKQTVRVRSNKESVVKLNLRPESAPVSALPASSAIYAKKPGHEWGFFPGKVEIPGRNF